jgi:hypothetical protein
VVLRSTHENALEDMPLAALKEDALDLDEPAGAGKSVDKKSTSSAS